MSVLKIEPESNERGLSAHDSAVVERLIAAMRAACAEETRELAADLGVEAIEGRFVVIAAWFLLYRSVQEHIHPDIQHHEWATIREALATMDKRGVQ